MYKWRALTRNAITSCEDFITHEQAIKLLADAAGSSAFIDFGGASSPDADNRKAEAAYTARVSPRDNDVYVVHRRNNITLRGDEQYATTASGVMHALVDIINSKGQNER